jgi:MFS family permease
MVQTLGQCQEAANEVGADRSMSISHDRVRRWAILMLASMVSLAILSQFYRSSIGVIAPNLMTDLNLSAADLGVLTGSFFIVFALLQIPVGVLLDRFGGRLVISAMMGLALAGSLWFALGNTLGALTAARVMIGVGFSGVMVGSLVICSRWFAPDRFTTAMAVLFACANAGNLVAAGPLAAAAIAWGWRGAFIAMTLITMALTLVFFLIVRDAPPGHTYHQRKSEPIAAIIKGLHEIWTYRDVRYIMPMIAVGYASAITVLGLWGGPYLYAVYGLDEIARGNVLSLMAISMIAGTLCYGPLDRRFNTRKGVVMVGGVITTGLLVLLAVWPSSSLWEAGIMLSLFCFFGAYSLVVMAHGVAFFPDRLAGRGVTTLNMCLMGGAALIPAVTGQIIGAFPDEQATRPDLPYRAMFLFLAGITALTLFVYSRAADIPPVRRDQPHVRRSARSGAQVSAEGSGD